MEKKPHVIAESFKRLGNTFRNVKQEKKYLEMMLKYGSDTDKLQAEGRLKVLNK